MTSDHGRNAPTPAITGAVVQVALAVQVAVFAGLCLIALWLGGIILLFAGEGDVGVGLGFAALVVALPAVCLGALVRSSRRFGRGQRSPLALIEILTTDVVLLFTRSLDALGVPFVAVGYAVLALVVVVELRRART